MPWFVLFSFLTVPFLVGVSVTLAFPVSAVSGGLGIVVAFAAVWLAGSIWLMAALRGARPKRWAAWWMVLAVAVPITSLFLVSLRGDPAILAVHGEYARRVAEIDARELAASSPSRHTPTWAEFAKLIACVRPRAAVFSLQLLKSLPLAWWLAAFLVSLRKGK